MVDCIIGKAIPAAKKGNQGTVLTLTKVSGEANEPR
jgi:hypothetical protein